jgi:hypothetical protein
LTKRNRETLRVVQRFSVGLGGAARPMILIGLRFGDGRAVGAFRQTLPVLQPKTTGETLQDPPSGGTSGSVEAVAANASSDLVRR